MKKLIQRILQKVLGFDRYLFTFANFKIRTFKGDKKEGDFFYFLNMLSDKATALDIGSNIGITTVHLSQKVTQGTVHSFEPVLPNFKTLKKVVAHHKCKNVKLYDYALGNENGEIEMIMPVVQDVNMQGLSHVVHEDLTDFNEGKKYKAKIKRLDDLSFITEQPIEGIKLDVENFEYFVLLGGKELLVRDHPIVYCELWDNENRQRCFQFMRSLNYQVKLLKNNKLEVFNPEKHETQNFFFVYG